MGSVRRRGLGRTHLSAARIPTHVAGATAAESLSVVLGEKLWRERKGSCRELPLGSAGGALCSQTLLWSFLSIANYWGKTDFGVEGRGWEGTDEVYGFF